MKCALNMLIEIFVKGLGRWKFFYMFVSVHVFSTFVTDL